MAANKKKKSVVKAKAKPAAKVKTKVKAKPKLTAKAAAPQKKSASKTPAPKKTVPAKSSRKGDNYLTPLDDRVLIEVHERATKTAGGIFIPDTVETQHTRGTIVAVGRGRRNKKGYVRPMDVQVGDEVLYAEFAGTPITIDSKPLLLMKEEELLGVIES